MIKNMRLLVEKNPKRTLFKYAREIKNKSEKSSRDVGSSSHKKNNLSLSNICEGVMQIKLIFTNDCTLMEYMIYELCVFVMSYLLMFVMRYLLVFATVRTDLLEFLIVFPHLMTPL